MALQNNLFNQGKNQKEANTSPVSSEKNNKAKIKGSVLSWFPSKVSKTVEAATPGVSTEKVGVEYETNRIGSREKAEYEINQKNEISANNIIGRHMHVLLDMDAEKRNLYLDTIKAKKRWNIDTAEEILEKIKNGTFSGQNGNQHLKTETERYSPGLQKEFERTNAFRDIEDFEKIFGDFLRQKREVAEATAKLKSEGVINQEQTKVTSEDLIKSLLSADTKESLAEVLRNACVYLEDLLEENDNLKNPSITSKEKINIISRVVNASGAVFSMREELLKKYARIFECQEAEMWKKHMMYENEVFKLFMHFKGLGNSFTELLHSCKAEAALLKLDAKKEKQKKLYDQKNALKDKITVEFERLMIILPTLAKSDEKACYEYIKEQKDLHNENGESVRKNNKYKYDDILYFVLSMYEQNRNALQYVDINDRRAKDVYDTIRRYLEIIEAKYNKYNEILHPQKVVGMRKKKIAEVNHKVDAVSSKEHKAPEKFKESVLEYVQNGQQIVDTYETIKSELNIGFNKDSEWLSYEPTYALCSKLKQNISTMLNRFSKLFHRFEKGSYQTHEQTKGIVKKLRETYGAITKHMQFLNVERKMSAAEKELFFHKDRIQSDYHTIKTLEARVNEGYLKGNLESIEKEIKSLPDYASVDGSKNINQAWQYLYQKPAEDTESHITQEEEKMLSFMISYYSKTLIPYMLELRKKIHEEALKNTIENKTQILDKVSIRDTSDTDLKKTLLVEEQEKVEANSETPVSPSARNEKIETKEKSLEEKVAYDFEKMYVFASKFEGFDLSNDEDLRKAYAFTLHFASRNFDQKFNIPKATYIKYIRNIKGSPLTEAQGKLFVRLGWLYESKGSKSGFLKAYDNLRKEVMDQYSREDMKFVKKRKVKVGERNISPTTSLPGAKIKKMLKGE